MTFETPPSRGPDTVPAYTGFIIGAIAIFVILFGIVKATHGYLESHDTPAAATTSEAAAPPAAAPATATAPPAAGAPAAANTTPAATAPAPK